MKPNLTSSAANFGLPRTLSTGLKAKIIFGNVLAFMGIIFFVMGMVQVIFFGVHIDFSKLSATGPASEDSPFPPWIILPMLIFPVAGLILFVIAFRKGKKNIKLVENGYFTKGKVVRHERTNTKINNRYVYKVFFEFIAHDGTTQQAMVRTHKTERVLDEAEEKLVFDSNNPSHAMLVDALPKAVRTYFEKLDSGL